MDTKAYRATRPDIEWIAGRRVQPGEPIRLTDREAEPELARGLIELVQDVVPAAAPEPEPAPARPRKNRED